MPELRDPMEGVVTTADLADELSVRPETVVRWIKEHRLKGAYRAGGRWYIPVEDARMFCGSYGSEDESDDGGEESDEDFDEWEDAPDYEHEDE